MGQPDTAHVEGLRLALARLRHGLGNALVLTDAVHDQEHLCSALWHSLLETQQLMAFLEKRRNFGR
jgi:hypothetical protein